MGLGTNGAGRQLPSSSIGDVEAALAALLGGGMVVVVDDGGNEGELVMAGEFASRETIAFYLAHTSGLICAPLAPERADTLQLHPMVSYGGVGHETAFTVSVDAKVGTTTGISAQDRALTFRVLSDPDARPQDLLRPGHVFPIRARPGGVFHRPRHTEATLDLLRLAGLQPTGVMAGVVGADRRKMAGPEELLAFCETHGFPLVDVGQVVQFRRSRERIVERRAGPARIPTEYGEFQGFVFTSIDDGREYLVFIHGSISSIRGSIPIAVHGECLVGNVFGSQSCGCQPELRKALERIAACGCGVLVYARGGRTIGPHIGMDARREARSHAEEKRTQHEGVVSGGTGAIVDDVVIRQVLAELGIRGPDGTWGQTDIVEGRGTQDRSGPGSDRRSSC